MGIFLIFLATVIMIGIIGAAMTSHTAGEFHASVVNEIEESNFADSVIAKCKESAVNLGYTLEVNPVTNDEGVVVMAEVILHYKFEIPFLSVSNSHQKINYAH